MAAIRTAADVRTGSPVRTPADTVAADFTAAADGVRVTERAGPAATECRPVPAAGADRVSAAAERVSVAGLSSCAQAAAVPPSTAAPTPRARANPPTLPTYEQALITVSFAHYRVRPSNLERRVTEIDRAPGRMVGA